MSAENTGASPLVANRYTASGWETFSLSQPQSGYYALKAVNSKFVAIQPSIQNTLIPTSSTENDVALFKIVTPVSPSSSTSVSSATQIKLFSKGAGAFIAVDSGSYFTASTGVIETATTFKLGKPATNQYTLQNIATAQYASADNAGANAVVVNRASPAGWESFNFISQPGSTYSIQVYLILFLLLLKVFLYLLIYF